MIVSMLRGRIVRWKKSGPLSKVIQMFVFRS